MKSRDIDLLSAKVKANPPKPCARKLSQGRPTRSHANAPDRNIEEDDQVVLAHLVSTNIANSKNLAS